MVKVVPSELKQIPVGALHPLQYSEDEVKEAIKKTGQANKLAMIYLETPANPNNALFDMSGLSKEIGKFYEKENQKEVIVAVDNTYMGPIWQHPLEHGADLTI